MAENKNLLLKISLILFAIMALGYGIIYLFFPMLQIKAAGGELIPPGWIRWMGGILIALGIGAVMVYKNPVKQKIFVFSMAIGTLLNGLTLLYTLLFEGEGIGNISNTLIPAIILLILSAMLWISLKQSKEILQ